MTETVHVLVGHNGPWTEKGVVGVYTTEKTAWEAAGENDDWISYYVQEEVLHETP